MMNSFLIYRFAICEFESTRQRRRVYLYGTPAGFKIKKIRSVFSMSPVFCICRCTVSKYNCTSIILSYPFTSIDQPAIYPLDLNTTQSSQTVHEHVTPSMYRINLRLTNSILDPIRISLSTVGW